MGEVNIADLCLYSKTGEVAVSDLLLDRLDSVFWTQPATEIPQLCHGGSGTIWGGEAPAHFVPPIWETLGFTHPKTAS